MSDSASDRNVEDVLSSVRRLVSNELPRMPRPTSQKPAAALVLTPADRVSEPPAASRREKSTSLEDRIAELEAAVSARADEWEPDGSEDQELHRPRRIVYTRQPTEAEKAGPAKPLRLSQIALIETGPANEDAPAQDEAEPVTFRPRSKPSPQIEDAPAEADAEDHLVDAVSEDLTAAVADMAEEALAQDEDFKSALTDAVQHSVEADVEAEAGVEVEIPEAEGDAPETPAEPVNIAAPVTAPVAADEIDMADLRPLVARLLREELQGELGERITRNVRKLVRREINRALTGREFE